MRWNPAACHIAFEYIETFKNKREMETFLELTKKQFKYAYRPDDVARCFRNLGYYFIEASKYAVAATCYMASLCFGDERGLAQSQLNYISKKAPKGYQKPTYDHFKQFAKQYGFPPGADEDILGLSQAYSRVTLEDGELKLAAYYLEIYCGLTADEESVKLLEDLKKKIAKNG